MIRRQYPGAIQALGEDEFRAVVSNSSVGRDRMRILTSGLDFSEYLASSPVLLFQHDPAQPIGRCVAMRVVGDDLQARFQFAPLGISDTADRARGLLKGPVPVLNALSIGFDIDEISPPRDGVRTVTRATLLECSIVSVPALPAARVIERAYRTGNQMTSEHLIRAEEAVAEAARRHHDLGRAMERGDKRGAASCHRELGRCLDRAQSAFKSAAAAAVLQDLENVQQTQNSDGMGKGTSGSHDYSVPLTRVERLAEALALQRPIVMDGGAVGVAAIREAEFIRARAHCEAAARAGAFSRELSFGQRQEDLRRLARPFG